MYSKYIQTQGKLFWKLQDLQIVCNEEFVYMYNETFFWNHDSHIIYTSLLNKM